MSQRQNATQRTPKAGVHVPPHVLTRLQQAQADGTPEPRIIEIAFIAQDSLRTKWRITYTMNPNQQITVTEEQL
jgi:hypothetical protein